jgi:rubrerythrin
MNSGTFQAIVDFAIKKEIEAAEFYTQAAGQVKYSGTKDLFLGFAREEEGHRKLLEGVDQATIAEARIQKIPDLRISDYLVDGELRPDIPYPEILRIAMKREERSVKLYQDLLPPDGDETLTKLFRFLIQEESKHKYQLEKIYDDEILK